MLYKLFITQWKQGSKDDWTEQVKNDLADVGLPEDLELIKSKSNYSFKTLVKIKIKEYAFFNYLEKKASHSKLDDLWYSDLQLQEYLKLSDLSAFEAKKVFSYRTRSAQYSANYPDGAGGLKPCPLCFLHLDCQPLAFQCPVIKENIQIKVKYSDIFESDVDLAVAKTLTKIDKLRDDHLSSRQIL